MEKSTEKIAEVVMGVRNHKFEIMPSNRVEENPEDPKSCTKKIYLHKISLKICFFKNISFLLVVGSLLELNCFPFFKTWKEWKC